MRQYIAGLLIFAQLLPLTPALGGREGRGGAQAAGSDVEGRGTFSPRTSPPPERGSTQRGTNDDGVARTTVSLIPSGYGSIQDTADGARGVGDNGAETAALFGRTSLPLDRASIQGDGEVVATTSVLQRRGDAAIMARDPIRPSLEAVDTFLSRCALTPQQIASLSRPTVAHLCRMEVTGFRLSRWVTVTHLLPRLATFPMLGERDVVGGNPRSGKRVWISGESLPVEKPETLKRVMGSQLFADLTVTLTSTLIHSAFTLLLGTQLVYAAQHRQSLRDVFFILWNGESNSIRDFYGLVQNVPHVKALFALAATPVVVGLVGGLIKGAVTSFPDTNPFLPQKDTSQLDTTEDMPFVAKTQSDEDTPRTGCRFRTGAFSSF